MYILHAKVVTPRGILNGNIQIKGGKINDISQTKPTPGVGLVYDAGGRYVLPGLIEVHGHMREPGMTAKEDVPHGTMAALAGGFTTIIDMPNTDPPTTTAKLVDDKLNKIYPGRSYTDYAIWMGVSNDHIGEISKIDKDKICGIKIFMAGHETVPTTIPDDKTLGKIFKIAAKRNILVALHTEDQSLVNYYTDKYTKLGITSSDIWSKMRPMSVVATAVARAIAIAELYGTRIYLLHMSTPEEFVLADVGITHGLQIWRELVTYQLLFNDSDYKKYGNKIKVSPALRSKDMQNEMWDRFRSGKLDVVCSEHTPHEWESKNQPNVFKAQSGTPGIQESLPALITAWIKRYGKDTVEEGLQLIARYASKNPARIFGFKNKGGIEVGKDADFSIIDINNTWNVNKNDLFSKCGWSAYEGMKLKGRPVATFLRGELVYQSGKILQNPIGKKVKV